MSKDKEFLLRFRITGKKNQPGKAPKLRGRTGSNNLKYVSLTHEQNCWKRSRKRFEEFVRKRIGGLISMFTKIG